ncbi:MAG: site-2 protease family protein [Planctomycetia bacterium]|nr:site-2 protease family protein [Planctomycetia bacterium]
MGLIQGGAFRIFRVAGINVFLHWTWLLVAAYSIQTRVNANRPPVWAVAEYLALFGIVLLHEFGHAFACRSVGGKAERIMLWPLGGIAFVEPPPRAGAVLWSIAAGPLVNVVLAPLLFGASMAAKVAGEAIVGAGAAECISTIAWINLGLLIFNLLPFYPLDGGQIFQSLLWFAVGRGRSLQIAGGVGALAGAAMIVIALLFGDMFLAVIAGFLMLQAWNGVRTGTMLRKLEALPRREGVHCPSCGERPVLGKVWPCERCQRPIDIFENDGVCGHCGHPAEKAICTQCGRTSPLDHASHDKLVEAWQA